MIKITKTIELILFHKSKTRFRIMDNLEVQEDQEVQAKISLVNSNSNHSSQFREEPTFSSMR